MRVRVAVVGALLVGCATGAAVRDLTLPARAAGNGAAYSYKIYTGGQLIELARKKDPKLTEGESIELALNDIGHAGWHLVQYVSQLNTYIFESAGSAEAPR